RFAQTEKPFPPLSDNVQKIRHNTEIYYIIGRNLVSVLGICEKCAVFRERININEENKTLQMVLHHSGPYDLS
ncbi:MAG TPA: hypothetical protein PLK80_17255, partial [bacterium]|nr:hypothetical protein [bacterium]